MAPETMKGLLYKRLHGFSVTARVTQLLQQYLHGGVAEIEPRSLNRNADVLRFTHDSGVNMAISAQVQGQIKPFIVYPEDGLAFIFHGA